MSFSKKVRQEVYNKTNGHCAYCGCELPKRWQVDHVVPVERQNGKYTGRGTDDIDNLLPSCPSCNNYKSCLDLEDFRDQVEHTYYTVLTGTKTILIAERYGIVERHKKEIEFYFEKIGLVVPSLISYEISEAHKRLAFELELLEDIGKPGVYGNKEYHLKEIQRLKDRINKLKAKNRS